MSHISRFEDMRAWQQARELTLALYSGLKTCKDYGYRDQIQRAAISIMNNLAEGFERNSDKELKQYLFIAKGSAGEVRSMLSIAGSLGYLSPALVQKFNDQAIQISKMIAVFIKKLD